MLLYRGSELVFTLESGSRPRAVYADAVAGIQKRKEEVYAVKAAAGHGCQVLRSVYGLVWLLWGCTVRGTCVQYAKVAYLEGASA